MKKLIKGITNFRKNLQKSYCDKFAKLAECQSPEALIISCCDSRVVPNIFTYQDPGDLFVLRNVGNIVPPYHSKDDNSAAVALEYSVFELELKDIIICGHSDCGAMAASLKEKLPPNYESIKKWLKYAKPSLQKLQEAISTNVNLTQQNLLSQLNVIQQLEHLKTYPYINERLQYNDLKIHGWWFDLETANVFSYDPINDEFSLK